MKNNETGFTILELLIATAILSIILLLVTVVMISIGSLYNKGLSESNTQDTARNIVSQISSQLELSADDATYGQGTVSNVNVSAYCIGGIRYSFVLNTLPGENGNTLQHVFWKDVPTGYCNPNFPADLTQSNPSGASATNGEELISPSTRLTSFCIGSEVTVNATCNNSSTLSSPYVVSIGLAFGSADLLCDNNPSPSEPPANNCNATNLSGENLSNINGQVTCRGKTGDEYCGTSYLNTVIDSRL